MCEVNYFSRKQIDQSARCSNNNLGTLSYFSYLIGNTCSAINRNNVEAFYFLHKPLEVARNLYAQLACRRYDKRLSGAVFFIYQFNQRQTKSCCFTRSCLSKPNQVSIAL